LLGEIKRHKRGAVLALATIIVAVAAATFAYYLYSVRGRTTAIDSIAVLPFANASGDPNMEYLSDGITESLINALSQLPQLKVIARSSVFKYKGKEIDLQEVAKGLGVEAIVIGRVTQRGDSLQVSAEMVNAIDKSQIWGEQFSRKASDIESVQQDIARSISDKLRLRLSGSQQSQLTKHASQNPQAYQLYLNGTFYSRKGGRENTTKALEYQNQAVALDPNFALAWAALANNYTYFASNSFLDPEETMKKARLAAERALALDETLAEAHVELARIKMYSWDWSGAEREYKRALELNSNLAGAHSGYSTCLSRMGRYDEAITESKRAQELDPLRISGRVNEAVALYSARRYDEAIQKLEAIIKMEPDSAISYSYLGYAHAAKGMYPQAIAAYQKAMSLDGENSSDQCYLTYALAQAGKKKEAQTLLDKLRNSKEYVSPAELAIAYLGLGDKEGAIASLEKAYAAHDLQMSFLKTEHYDSLRSDPRFQELMRRVGFAP
jgi:TolB-like protein/Tfp pilus assembly protein PilF